MAWISAAIAAFATEATDPPNVGVQLGGPGVFEVVYRHRFGGPVLLELGGFFVGGGGFLGNASLGVVVELEPPSNAQPYLVFGGGAAGGCGEGESGLGCGGIVYGYSRFGFGLHVGPPPSNLVTLDVGGWFGAVSNDERGFRRLLIPMTGVGYYW